MRALPVAVRQLAVAATPASGDVQRTVLQQRCRQRVRFGDAGGGSGRDGRASGQLRAVGRGLLGSCWRRRWPPDWRRWRSPRVPAAARERAAFAERLWLSRAPSAAVCRVARAPHVAGAFDERAGGRVRLDDRRDRRSRKRRQSLSPDRRRSIQ